MITPTRIREIFAEELRKAGEDQRAERVLNGSEVGSVYWAALKAMQRIAEEAPQVLMFEALKNRLDEVGKQHTVEREACDTQRPDPLEGRTCAPGCDGG
jgi:hypothetical protein